MPIHKKQAVTKLLIRQIGLFLWKIIRKNAGAFLSQKKQSTREMDVL